MIGGKNKRIEELERQLQESEDKRSLMTRHGYQQAERIEVQQNELQQLRNEQRHVVSPDEAVELREKLSAALTKNAELKEVAAQQLNQLKNRCGELQHELDEKTQKLNTNKSIMIRFERKIEKLKTKLAENESV